MTSLCFIQHKSTEFNNSCSPPGGIYKWQGESCSFQGEGIAWQYSVWNIMYGERNENLFGVSFFLTSRTQAMHIFLDPDRSALHN